MRRKSVMVIILLFMAVATVFLLRSPAYEEQINPESYRCSDCNVVIITVDALRADHLGCYGYVRNTSPNIDKLAENSVLFEQAAVQWPKTSPSMASMHTGTYGHTNGVMRGCKMRLHQDNTILAEALKGEGYATGGFVANSNLASFYNFDQGMDVHVFPDESCQWGVNCSVPAELLYSHISRFLDGVGEGKFYLWAHFIDPHAPYTPPQPYNDLFIDDEYYGYEELEFDYSEECEDNFMHRPCVRVKEGNHTNHHHYVAQYDGEIAYADHYIGLLMDKLEADGMLDDTLVILTADHGESLGDHDFYYEHGLLPYDACSRVPLMISHPNLPKGRSMGEVVGLIDVMPTTLDFIGAKIPEIVEGESLFPLIFTGEGHDRYVYSEAGYQENYMRSVRDSRWKLIYVPSNWDRGHTQGSIFELYDVIEDPSETENLFYSRPLVSARLLPRLGWFMMTEKHHMPEAEQITPDNDAMIENLKALGYMT
ncbi:MAG: sulfatase-like hydrolase/transferase [Candidatus Altiarchaeales archaeon]|nr:sulfatase-like hydrolase/transferase [Candidatus Altiarchaeales archaeon]MBD3417284.1 sulfatase-like hydrolase/transferase [Candidatus Altiarchaeales archaeon]